MVFYLLCSFSCKARDTKGLPYELNMLRMVLGQQASSTVVPSSYHPFHLPVSYGYPSSSPHPSSDSSDVTGNSDCAYPTKDALTYFKL